MPPSTDDIAPHEPTEVVDGIGPSRSDDLANAGIKTVEDLQEADLTDLIAVVPGHVARSVKERVGNTVKTVTTAAEARERAQDEPGAKAKVVKDADGRQRPKVLRKVQEKDVGGATMEVHKG